MPGSVKSGAASPIASVRKPAGLPSLSRSEASAADSVAVKKAQSAPARRRVFIVEWRSRCIEGGCNEYLFQLSAQRDGEVRRRSTARRTGARKDARTFGVRRLDASFARRRRPDESGPPKSGVEPAALKSSNGLSREPA